MVSARTIYVTCFAILIAMSVLAQPLRPTKANQTGTDQFKDNKPNLGFIENKGQILNQDNSKNNDVKYILPLPNNNVLLKRFGFSYDTYKDETIQPVQSGKLRASGANERVKIKRNYHRVDIEFEGANPDAKMIAVSPSEDYLNFFNSDGTGSKAINTHHYEKIIYKDIYPNIDVEFIAKPGSTKPVEYNFIVNPGADINSIQLRYSGSNKTTVSNSKIELKLAHATITENIPLSYWKNSNEKVKVDYKNLSKRNRDGVLVGFSSNIQKIDQPLIIDPVPTLVWEGTLPAAIFDETTDLLVSSTGDVYVVGSAFFGNQSVATQGAYQSTVQGLADGILFKYNVNGTLVWATYYGNSGYDIFYGVRETLQGQLLIAGFNDTLGSALIKFNTSGTAVLSVNYFGGSSTFPTSLESDSNGNLYVTGRTSDGSFATSGAQQSSINGGEDSFLVKFNSAEAMQWATYFGGAGQDLGNSISVDAIGNIFITGSTTSLALIATSGSHQENYGGGDYDGFLAKYNSSGSLLWSTYYGGDQYDALAALKLDSDGDVYILGNTTSTNGISTFGGSPSGVAFLAKFNSAGARQWGTYSPAASASDFCINPDNRIFITGRSQDGQNAFISEYTGEGSQQWIILYDNLYNGSSSPTSIDEPRAIAYASNSLYITGFIGRSINNTYSRILFLAKFELPCNSAPEITLNIFSSQYACATKFAPSRIMQGCSATSYFWDFGDGNTSSVRSPIHSYATAATYTVTLQVNYACGDCSSQANTSAQVGYNPTAIELENTLIEATVEHRENVLAITTTTFADSWLLQHEASSLSSANSFLNGSEGVWRSEGSYVYDAVRQSSAQVVLAADGTYAIDQFDWSTSQFEVVPNWIKANTMTEYSPYSFELENKDVLGVYSAALYDYDGQLPSANGANMRNKEMGFTSFEFLNGNVSGNFVFGTAPLQASSRFRITAANDNIAIVEVPISKLQIGAIVEVLADGGSGNIGRKIFEANEIICLQQHPDNDQWSVIVFLNAPSGYWTGVLRLKSEITPIVLPDLDNSVAHSGKTSLKVQSANKLFSQPILKLDSGKSYQVSGWVSVNNLQPLTPVMANNLGLEITLKQKNGQVYSTTTIQPVGSIIEGWQQVKGIFNCGINDAALEITFKPGSGGTAWYDDLRIHPEKGNMKSYVYDLTDYRLQAILDEENFASFFFYDAEGNLHLTKKETREGIKTINENVSYQIEH